MRVWAQLPISSEEFMTEQKALQQELFPNTKPLPGAITLLSTLSSSPSHIHLALATSSHAANYALKTTHLKPFFDHFPPQQRVLGDDPRIAPGRGKPAGDIYLLALETINKGIRETGGKEIAPVECLVFEDSVPGVEAGRRAGMRVVWCPHEGLREEYKGKEEVVLAGMTGEGSSLEEQDVENEKDVLEEQVRQIAVGVGAERGLKGWPGKVGDGWGVQVETLEHFNYARWGIKLEEDDR